MKYVLKLDEDIKVQIKEVKKNTVITHEVYGDIVVSAGNFILKFTTGPNKDEQIGITQSDIDAHYTPAED